MRFPTAFSDLLKNTVNLPDSKLDQLDRSVDAVFDALRSDPDLPVRVLRKIPQGSWAHKTITNPRREAAEFDADFILELEEHPDWDLDPRAYRREVLASLRRHHRYGEMPTTTKCRCVRLTYAGAFHLDIVPFVRRAGDGFIINCDANEWEPADPTGFTDWFNNKNRITGGNLRRAMRILKYVRDGSDWAGTRSVLLMILMGERVTEDHLIRDPGYYADVATTLVHLLEDLDAHLWPMPNKPSMLDPAESGTNFDHRWNQRTYARLRDRIHTYAQTARVALDEEGDPQRSLELWQKLLGDRFQANTARRPTTTGPFGAVPLTPSRSGRAG